ncbi:hypothetical protein ACL7TT_10055 [Microbulbifer sp. 2304DJ12-6]|uniref:hypothetical protein n=1 Tax=Microbulbifer sp. 2304DJ12-6 TaxID=3233340 RepID=UPI0039B103B3
MVFGWTWAHIRENVDLPQLEAMNRYWKRFPPVHVLVAAFVGYQGGKPSSEPGSAEELLAMLPLKNAPPQPDKPD